MIAMVAMRASGAKGAPEAGPAPVTGSWALEIKPSPDSGLPPLINALVTFDEGGGMVETVILPPVTSAHGTWQRTGKRHFVFVVVHHLVDPAGNFVGTVRAKSFAAFVGRDKFQADFEGGLYDPAGNLVAPVSGTEKGKRITVDSF
jgi:hypothetical protein